MRSAGSAHLRYSAVSRRFSLIVAAPALVALVVATGCSRARPSTDSTVAQQGAPLPTRGRVADHVLVISVDGLRPDAITRYEAETLQRMMRELKESGFIQDGERGYELTAKAMRKIGEKALGDIVKRIRGGQIGEADIIFQVPWGVLIIPLAGAAMLARAARRLGRVGPAAGS